MTREKGKTALKTRTAGDRAEDTPAGRKRLFTALNHLGLKRKKAAGDLRQTEGASAGVPENDAEHLSARPGGHRRARDRRRSVSGAHAVGYFAGRHGQPPFDAPPSPAVSFRMDVHAKAWRHWPVTATHDLFWFSPERGGNDPGEDQIFCVGQLLLLSIWCCPAGEFQSQIGGTVGDHPSKLGVFSTEDIRAVTSLLRRSANIWHCGFFLATVQEGSSFYSGPTGQPTELLRGGGQQPPPPVYRMDSGASVDRGQCKHRRNKDGTKQSGDASIFTTAASTSARREADDQVAAHQRVSPCVEDAERP